MLLSKRNYIPNAIESYVKKYSKDDHRALALWSLDCAERVLPLFDRAFPDEDRPRIAIEVGRKWVRTGIFEMAEIRCASLSAHAAARRASKDAAACFAARAAGQAVAAAHVPQHAYGSAYYALKAVAAANPEDAERAVAKEREWQAKRIPKEIGQEVMNRIIVEKRKDGIYITVRKGAEF